MGFNFKRSLKIAPGTRLNVGKKSMGISLGTKGLRYSINSRSGSRTTLGLPGTGVSYSIPSSRKYKSNAYRKNQELKQKMKNFQKEQEIERAKSEVELYQNRIRLK